jgi:hypothetical protein
MHPAFFCSTVKVADRHTSCYSQHMSCAAGTGSHTVLP